MRIRGLALWVGLALLAAPGLRAADCRVDGTITEIGQRPPSMVIALARQEGETRYYEIEERGVPNWRRFEVGQDVEGTCEDNGESPPRITRLQQKKKDRR